jgi:hypothetical protein
MGDSSYYNYKAAKNIKIPEIINPCLTATGQISAFMHAAG